MLIPVVAPDRNFCSGTKSDRTFHQYQVKEVGAYSDTELRTWIGWVDQPNQCDLTALSFQNENFYVNVEGALCVSYLNENSLRCYVNTAKATIN